MAKASKKIYHNVEEVLQDVLDSDFEFDSDSELGDLSSEEEELINEGLDPEVDVAQSRYVFVPSLNTDVLLRFFSSKAVKKNFFYVLRVFCQSYIIYADTKHLLLYPPVK
jgi:hypothetical protein